MEFCGPTGYTGLELLRLLLRHPEAEIVYLGARREERPPISEIWPILRGRLDMRCSLLEKDPVPKMDLAFLALPHTLAMDHVPALLKSGVRVVDISADYRLKDPAAFKKWYKVEHKDPANLQHAVYGLCELFRDEIKRARLVANPGCYATAIQLALAPLLRSHMASPGRAHHRGREVRRQRRRARPAARPPFPRGERERQRVQGRRPSAYRRNPARPCAGSAGATWNCSSSRT